MDGQKVAIVGIGLSGFKPITNDLSYRELIYEAATKAYNDAGIEAKDVESFISCSEDFMEGISIADEYVPEQLGAVLKPVESISGCGIQGLAAAIMQILTGRLNLMVVSSFSKASNILDLDNVLSYAFDPVYNRPLNQHPYFLAGLEMNRFLYESSTTRQQCAKVVVKNRANALKNPYASYPAELTVEEVVNSKSISCPLSYLDISQPTDGAIVLVLARESIAKNLSKNPIWIKGIGWATDTSTLESNIKGFGQAIYANLAANMAYKMAKVKSPAKEINFAEVSDLFSYKELQHLEAIGLAKKGEAGKLLEQGVFDKDGDFPVNVSGGSLGGGDLFDASGLYRIAEVCLQLRYEAGERQLKNVTTGLAMNWRGLPTRTGTVAILNN